MNDKEIYGTLPYFLRSYVNEKGWSNFREVQVKAFEVLFDSNNHLLIASGTSSGKTEAAFFPVLSQISQTKCTGISVLYVSPLKALIDDQFDRVSRMICESSIEIHSWHGDISSSKKRKVLEGGTGILQITPESLDNIVNRHYQRLQTVFGQLQFIIIDEVHSFMNSERGLQLLCQLDAIERTTGCNPRRIGLSATLSDFSIAQEWLKANSDREVKVVECIDRPHYDLKIDFTTLAPKGSDERQKSLRIHYEKLYIDTHDYNCIVFANGRKDVENTVSGLKLMEKVKRTNKFILAHHSSVGKEFREYAEQLIKDPELKCTAVSTSTLELGIDIGDLERVVQINAPHSVSSFVQKFGRSGRRNGHPVMIIHSNTSVIPSLPGIEVDLVKSIAEALLYLEDEWVEPVNYSYMPFSLLFQQTVSYVKSRVTATIKELTGDVLSMYPFKYISSTDYKSFLDYLVVCQILDFHIHYHTYCLGSMGDKVSRHFDFSSNFITIKEMDVYQDSKLIGTVQSAQGPGGLIQLAGQSWQVISVDEKMNRIYVRPSEHTTESYWKSGYADVNTRILQKMLEVLSSTEQYPFLNDTAISALAYSRQRFNELYLRDRLTYVDGLWRLYPWLGTIHFDTLYRILIELGIANSCNPPYSITIRENYRDLNEIRRLVVDYMNDHGTIDLVDEDDVMNASTLGKYNRYVDKELLCKQFCLDRLEFSEEIIDALTK